MKSAAYLPPVSEFIIKCQDKTTRPNEAGFWSISNLEPGSKISITAEKGNLILESEISKIEANKTLSNLIVDSMTTAECILKSEINARITAKSASPLFEDICTLKTLIDQSIANGDHRAAKLRELPDPRKAVERAIKKYEEIDFTAIRPGTIQVQRFIHDFPEAAEYDTDSNGFFSEQEFEQFKSFIKIITAPADQKESLNSTGTSGTGIPVSGIKGLSIKISEFDINNDKILTSKELIPLNNTLSEMITKLPGTEDITEYFNPQLKSRIYYEVPSLYEPDFSDDSTNFDENLGAFISGVALRRAKPGISFNIGIVEQLNLLSETSSLNPALEIKENNTALSKTANNESPTEKNNEITGIDIMLESISLDKLLNKYPGSKIYDSDDDGILKGDEFRLFYYTLPQGIKSRLNSVESKGSSDYEKISSVLGIKCAEISEIMSQPERYDNNGDGYLDSFSEFPRLMKYLNSKYRAFSTF
jgi:hypothetical protein